MDAALLETLVHDGYIPVVASVAADETGQSLNVNADIAAGEARPAANEVYDLFFEATAMYGLGAKFQGQQAEGETSRARCRLPGDTFWQC